MSSLVTNIRKSLYTLFVPHNENNWRPKYLHNDFLTLVIGVLLLLNITFKFALSNVSTSILGVSTDLSVEALLNYTNAERAKSGLSALKLNSQLTTAAQQKAADMFTNNYWAHFGPNGTSPWYFFDQNNYHYTFAGENLAKDFSSSQSVVIAWMNSEKHRENILKPEYQEIGFAIAEGTLLGQPTTLVVQLFGTQDPTFVAQAPAESAPAKAKSTLKLAATNPQITPEVASQQIKKSPLIDLGKIQKEVLFAVLGILIVVLAIDLYVIEKNKVFRLSGKNIAHLMFTLFFILSILIAKSGLIL